MSGNDSPSGYQDGLGLWRMCVGTEDTVKFAGPWSLAWISRILNVVISKPWCPLKGYYVTGKFHIVIINSVYIYKKNYFKEFFNFIRFESDRRELPVLWHQALLTFVQRYKEDLSPDQKQSLLDVVKFHTHYVITPEVSNELCIWTIF